MKTNKSIQKTLEDAIVDLYINLKIQENVINLIIKLDYGY